MSIVKAVCRVMERVAPLRLAESWDNVGLLLESPPLQRTPNPEKILLTIDITTPVLREAISKQSSMIISYHPPIFRPLSSLTLSNPLQASLLQCIQASISVYSPHTALDATRGGVNDWLVSCLYGIGPVGEVKCVEENVSETNATKEDANANSVPFSNNTIGAGRIVEFAEGAKVLDVVNEIKRKLNLHQVQVALPNGKNLNSLVSSIAVCAGSGGSLLSGVEADLYFTGEMSHHEVLAAVAKGRTVVLCGHTNTERGFLAHLRSRLLDEFSTENELKDLHIEISEADAHPLIYV